MTPRSFTSLLGEIEQAPTLMEATSSSGGKKRGEVNDFSLLWVTFKHVRAGHDILDTKRKIS